MVILMKNLLKTLLFLLATVPGFAQAPRTLELGLKQAVDLALSPEGSLRLQIAEEMIHQAEARSAQSRAALLPNLEASFSQQSVTRNLEASGIRFQLPLPGFAFPRLVGPFNIFDARASVAQSVFDLSSIRRFQSSRAALSQAEAEKESAQDQVRARVSQAYLAALRAEAALETARANVDLAEATLKLVNSQKAAGTGTGIEVARARVQLANARQALLVAENEAHRSRLQLLRAIGLDLGVGIRLTGKLEFLPVKPVDFAEALRTALDSRADWKAEQKRLETVELGRSAVRAERLPSVGVFGDYGAIGTGADHSIPTRAYGVAVKIPIFDGGRRDARRAESASQLRQEEVQVRDLRAQIELEIRLALDTLESAAEQVKVAEEGLTLVQDEVAHAQRRYESGVTGSLEVTDAQTRLERARENRIAALFNYNRARLDLGSATGTIAQMIQ
jgi:outer membrane protein